MSEPTAIDRVWSMIARRHQMAAGLADSGFASLATFTIGVFAVRNLDPITLGAYALCYSAIFLVGILPQNLVLLPAEVAVVSHPAGMRIPYLRRSLLLGVVPAVIAGLAVLLWVFAAPAEIPTNVVIGLTVTGTLSAILSPLQDHVRRILHSGGASWAATRVSTVQLVAAVLALAGLRALGLPVAWIPFGALAVANLTSLVYGASHAWRRRAEPIDPATLQTRDLYRSGRWFVGGGVAAPATGFMAAAIVSHLAGSGALGYAEAARVVSQPVWVLAVGLSSVLGPRSMTAARNRDRGRARRISLGHIGTVAVVGVAVMAAAGWPWPGNPLVWLLPAAYFVPGLALAMMAAQTLHGMTFAYRSELLGARREAPITKYEAVAGLGRLIVASSAPWTGAFAIPLGLMTLAILRFTGFRWMLRDVYREPAPPSAVSGEPGP